MSGRLVGTYDLLDRVTGRFVEAHLHSPADEANVADFERLWRPAFETKKVELELAGNLTLQSLGENDAQDGHWDWPGKIDLSEKRLDRQSFAIIAEGVTQGLML